MAIRQTRDMEQTKTESTAAVFPYLAAQTLSIALGESELVWTIRLTNWRRPTRQSPIHWWANDAGRPVYAVDAVQAYIDGRLAHRLTVTPPDSGPGKARATATADIENNHAFVRVFWNAGTAQGAFSLSPKAAADLAEKLLREADRAGADLS